MEISGDITPPLLSRQSSTSLSSTKDLNERIRKLEEENAQKDMYIQTLEEKVEKLSNEKQNLEKDKNREISELKEEVENLQDQLKVSIISKVQTQTVEVN